MSSLSRKIFAALFATAVVVAALVALVTTLVYQHTIDEDASDYLSRSCRSLKSMVEASDAYSRNDLTGVIDLLEMTDLDSSRATLISDDGTVLFDSAVDAASLPNHAGRPEVAEALSQGEGSSERTSTTVGYVSLYHAVLLSNGDVLRLSEDHASVVRLLVRDVDVLLGLLFAIAIACWFVARSLAKHLVEPILAIDPAASKSPAPYRELEPLTDRLAEQQDELKSQMHQLQDAAAVRQQYTSNVTHELKTPIASISGAAELIESGLVKPQDIGEFGHRIHSDATRLKDLVNDILMLSRLDESERMGDTSMLGAPEPCDLLSIAHDVERRLAGMAGEQHVSIKVKGSSTTVVGWARLLDEIVNNLASNGVRYNKPGGRVEISVGTDRGCAFVKVADTGIGIPASEREKIFARFYRVDASRSRDLGGTGLGLAIVKHAAALHHATIQLESAEGAGTTVVVKFPGRELPKDILANNDAKR